MSGARDAQHPPLAQSARRGFMSPEVMELITPAFNVGLWSGSAGVVAGIGGSIATETSPILGGTMTGISWFTLGSTYWLTRSATARAWGGEQEMKPLQKTALSAISGSAAGAVSGVLRGPSSIVRSMVFWSVVGAGGQLVANQMGSSESSHQTDDGGFFSRWGLMTKLSDEEYINKMREKILAVDADIALIDERIMALRAAEQSMPQTK